MNWETLDARSSRRTDEPAISVQKNYRVSWNQGAQKAMGGPEYIEILLNREAGLLGLRRAEKSETTFPVRRVAGQRSWGVSAQGALVTAGITDVERSHRRYADAEELADGSSVLFIDISPLLGDDE